MKMSISGRKNPNLHISDHIPHVLGHAKEYGKSHINLDDIDYIYGFPMGFGSPLLGGRLVDGGNISREELHWLYYNNIGLKIPMTSVYFTEALYQESLELLTEFHRKGNSILVSTDKLAMRIKEDFPLYALELSAVKDVDSHKKMERIDRSLYDTICLPICANDELSFLEELDNKEQIRLFWNVECSYNCPNKFCYTSISKRNKGDTDEDMKCSSWTYNMPRTFVKDVDWSKFYFDLAKYQDMGFTKWKLLNPDAKQQRVELMRDEIEVKCL
jgi:hypothetical protein